MKTDVAWPPLILFNNVSSILMGSFLPFSLSLPPLIPIFPKAFCQYRFCLVSNSATACPAVLLFSIISLIKSIHFPLLHSIYILSNNFFPQLHSFSTFSQSVLGADWKSIRAVWLQMYYHCFLGFSTSTASAVLRPKMELQTFQAGGWR